MLEMKKFHFTFIIYDYMYTCVSGLWGMSICMQTPQRSEELDSLELELEEAVSPSSEGAGNCVSSTGPESALC